MRKSNQIIQKFIYCVILVFILNFPINSQSTENSTEQSIDKKINISDFPEHKFLQIFTDALRKSKLRKKEESNASIKEDNGEIKFYEKLYTLLGKNALKDRIATIRDSASISKTKKRTTNYEITLKSAPIENLINFIYDIENENTFNAQITECNLSKIQTSTNSDLDTIVKISTSQNENEDNESKPLNKQSKLINLFSELFDFFPNEKEVYFEFKELSYSEDGFLIYGKVKKENEIDTIINNLKKSNIFKKVQSIAVEKNENTKEKGFLYKITLNDFKENNSSVNSQDYSEDEHINNLILDWSGFQKILIPIQKEKEYSEKNLVQLNLLRLEKLKIPEGSSIQFVNDNHLKSKEDILNVYEIFKNETTFKLGVAYNGEVKEYNVYIVGKESSVAKKESKIEKENKDIKLKHPKGVVIPINHHTKKQFSPEEMKEFQKLIEIFPKNSMIPRYLTPKEFKKQDKKNKLIKEIALKINNKQTSKDELEIYYKNIIKLMEDKLEIANYLIKGNFKENSPVNKSSSDYKKKKDLIQKESNLLKEQRKKIPKGDSK